MPGRSAETATPRRIAPQDLKPPDRLRYNLVIREGEGSRTAGAPEERRRAHALLPGLFHAPHGAPLQAHLRKLRLLYELRRLLLRPGAHVRHTSLIGTIPPRP